MSAITQIERVLDVIEDTLNWIATTMMFVIMAIIVANVVFRYVFNSPFGWSYELIQLYLMVGLFFFVLSHALNANAHVCVDLLLNYFPTRIRHLTEFIGYFSASMVFAGIVYVSIGVTWTSFVNHEVMTGAVAWPMWLAHIAVPIGCSVMLLRMIFRFVGHGLSVITGRSIITLPPLSGSGEH